MSAECLKIGKINLAHGFLFKISELVAGSILFNMSRLDHEEQYSKFITGRIELHSKSLATLSHKESVQADK